MNNDYQYNVSHENSLNSMEEKTIVIKTKNKSERFKAPSDYFALLKMIKRLFGLSDDEMAKLTMAYKDPDEDEDAEGVITLGDDKEYKDFLEESHKSFIILKMNNELLNKNSKPIQDNKSFEDQKTSAGSVKNKKDKSITKAQQSSQDNISQLEDKSFNEDKLLQRIEQVLPKINKTEMAEINKLLKEIKDDTKSLRKKCKNMGKEIEALKTDAIQSMKEEILDAVKKEVQSIKAETLKTVQEKTKKEIRKLIEEQATMVTEKVGQSITEMKGLLYEKTRSKVLHKGYTCNGCEKEPIEGVRYKCSQCDELNLCEMCFEEGVHSEHFFLLIRNTTIFNMSMKGKRTNDSKQAGNNQTETVYQNIQQEQDTPKATENKQSKKLYRNNQQEEKTPQQLESSPKQKYSNDKPERDTPKPSAMKPLEEDENDEGNEEIPAIKKDLEQPKSQPKPAPQLNINSANPMASTVKKTQANESKLKKSKVEASEVEPDPDKNWDEEFEIMERDYEISQLGDKDVVIRALKQSKGNLESAYELLLSQNNG